MDNTANPTCKHKNLVTITCSTADLRWKSEWNNPESEIADLSVQQHPVKMCWSGERLCITTTDFICSVFIHDKS